MKSKASSLWGAGAIVALTACVACGGADDGADALPGNTAGSSGAGGGSAGGAGKATGGTGGTAGTAGKAGGGNGGAAGKAGGGGSAGVGGNSGAAGNAGKAGTGGTGGTAGTAGAAGTAGTAGKAGGGGTAGNGGAGKAGAGGAAAGTGGAAAGTGGASAGTGGAAAGTGGAAAGTGGAAAGTGGAAAGTGGAAAGTGGAGGAGAGGAGAGGAGAGGAGAGGTGGTPGCTGTDTACTTGTNTQGLCRAAVCDVCTEPADDGACTAAYGAGNVCLAGACTSCDAVTNGVYIVDPINGSDTIGTGSGTAGSAASARCAFKTVTAAIAAIGPNAAGADLTISILGPNALDATEVYPLKVPKKTTVTTNGGDVLVKPVNDVRAFELTTDGSKLDGGAALIDIDGTSQTGNNTLGVFVGTGATDATTIRNVRISDSPAACLAVGGTGHVTIAEGVHILKCGRLNNQRGAVVIGDGAAFATFVAPSGSIPIHIEQSPIGVAVVGNGAMKMTGVPDATAVDKGTILIEKNLGPGIAIGQNIPVGGPALCDLDGVVSFGNGTGVAGSGLRSAYTSNVKVRNSVFLGNTAHGVHVTSTNGAAGVLRVDLGNAAVGAEGHNVVQRTNAQGNINIGVGICLSPGNLMNLTLPARGNVFGANDCATAAGTLVKLANGGNACSGGRDIGVDQMSATNTIEILLCQ